MIGLKADYSSAKISELIEAGKAKRNGAQFANQGLGCETFLWQESKEHHVFFFMRNGRSYGEYREEFLKEGRFLTIKELFLIADLRDPDELQNKTNLKYVRRLEKLEWLHDVCVASTIEWSFMETGNNNKMIQIGDSKSQRIVRGVVSVIFPDVITPDGKLFDVGLDRAKLIPEEVAYGDVDAMIESFGISNRRCSIWAKWPEDNAKLTIILNEKVKPEPMDSWPFPYRLREVARMSISLESPRNTPFVFESTGKTQ